MGRELHRWKGSRRFDGPLAYLASAARCVEERVPSHWKRSHTRHSVITSSRVQRKHQKHHWRMCRSTLYFGTKKSQMVDLTWPWIVVPIFLHTLAKIALGLTIDEAEASRESLEASIHRQQEGWCRIWVMTNQSYKHGFGSSRGKSICIIANWLRKAMALWVITMLLPFAHDGRYGIGQE